MAQMAAVAGGHQVFSHSDWDWKDMFEKFETCHERISKTCFKMFEARDVWFTFTDHPVAFSLHKWFLRRNIHHEVHRGEVARGSTDCRWLLCLCINYVLLCCNYHLLTGSDWFIGVFWCCRILSRSFGQSYPWRYTSVWFQVQLLLMLLSFPKDLSKTWALSHFLSATSPPLKIRSSQTQNPSKMKYDSFAMRYVVHCAQWIESKVRYNANAEESRVSGMWNLGGPHG